MARNGSGTYSKVNTFVAAATITAAGHNQNWDDIATEITNSVAADGQTSMTGVLKNANGTVGAPAITFASDLDSGFYRIGVNNVGLTLNGAKVVDYSTTGVAITGTLSCSGALTPAGVLSAPNGTVSLPAHSFTNELDCGAYVIGANNIGYAVNGAKVLDIATTGLSITGVLNATGDVAINTNKFTVAAATGNTVVAGTLGVTGALTASAAIGGATASGAMIASQAQQETGTAVDFLVTPGRQQFHASAAKAWAYVTGAGTPVNSASYNLSSPTDNAAGDFSLNMITAFSSANYAIVGIATYKLGVVAGQACINDDRTQTTSAANIAVTSANGTIADQAVWAAALYGDQ